MADFSLTKEIIVCHQTSRRAKRISVTVKPGGLVVATRPVWASESSANRFLASKRSWIVKAAGKMSKKKAIAGSSGSGGYKENLRAARELVKQKIDLINKAYGFNVGNVRIKNQASRWGSCSRLGNLNFNYRIALLPDALAEYVVAHELCHIKELNHSRAFWDLVALTVPDHRARRKELRDIIFT